MKTAVRLDDITPQMNYERFNRIGKILDEAGIKPLIGVVPFLKDETLMQDGSHEDFPQLLKQLQKKGWQIALHGYNHLYTTENMGMFPLNNFSEFAGVPYEKQYSMIKEGIEQLKEWGVTPTLFMAPGHTFDRKTLKALKENGIVKITDGFGNKPYIKDGITFYPISKKRSECVGKKEGYSTYVIHADTMTDSAIDSFEKLIKENRECFISFDEYIRVEPCERDSIQARKEYAMAIAKHFLVSRRASKGTVIHKPHEE